METAGRSLGLPADWDRSRIRRQIIKVLRKLSLRYQLLDADFPFGRNAKVLLKNRPGPVISVPGPLLGADSVAQQSSGESFLALAREQLRQEGLDIDLLSADALEKRYGIGASSILRARDGSPGQSL